MFTQKEFIDKCKESHTINYDYSKVEYKGLRHSVIVGCPIHGYVNVFAQSFINGSNCNKCEIKKKTKSTDKFISQAKKVHGDRYDYSKVKYINRTTEVEIICKKHGSFFVLPYNHIKKSGGNCPKCTYENYSKLITGINRNVECNKEKFIKRSKEKFGDKFDYSKIQYKGLDKNIILICPIHGEFKMRPDAHFRSKTGCPRCSILGRRKIICNFGIYDYNESIDKQIESLWRGMIHRCYDKKTQIKNPSYIGCSVCEEWRYFSNFYKWITNPENGYKRGYAIDKDILIQGNRIYSPETCCCVPININSFFVKNRKIKNGNLPQGVVKHAGKFMVSITFNRKSKHLGYYESLKEATFVYNKYKYKTIKKLAEENYKKGKIIKRIYDAMIGYKINEGL